MANTTKNMQQIRHILQLRAQGVGIREIVHRSATCWTPTQIDNLTYTYIADTNKLQKIADAAPVASRTSGWNNPMAAPTTAQYQL